jgi:hypothetical protein
VRHLLAALIARSAIEEAYRTAGALRPGFLERVAGLVDRV